MDDVETAAKERPGQEPEDTGIHAVGSPPCRPVVAIGASAGGLEAIQELFRHMPADTGFAFVVVQHLSPRHETLIPTLLASLTAMPVRKVESPPLGEAKSRTPGRASRCVARPLPPKPPLASDQRSNAY